MSTLTVGAAGAGGAYDYTCDGTADEVQINAAIVAAGAGDTVQLSAGTFACAADVTVLAGVSLIGAADTTLSFATGAVRQLIARGNNLLDNFTITGPCRLFVRGSDIDVANVVSHQAIHGDAAFLVYAISETLSNITFTDSAAVDTSGVGWFFSGEGTAPAISGVTLTRCTATNCGLSHDADNAVLREWVTGFNFAEAGILTIGDIHVTDCHAVRCYESGFHCEFEPAIASPCTITNCTATNCGNDKPSPDFGAGFLAPPSWTLTDCVSTGCYRGFYTGNHIENHHGGELAALIRCQAVAPTYRGYHLGGSAAGPLDGPVLTDCLVSSVAAPNNYLWLGNVINAQITNLRVVDCTGTATVHGASSNNTITYYLAPFRASIAAPVTGETVAFTEMSENDGLAAWSWDFGDGSGSAAQHPTHVYPSAGVYPVTLAAGGNVVSQTITVVPGVSFGGARLSEADIGPLDHDPVANATDLHNGRVGLQGSPVSRKAWTINALTDDHAEIEALAALKGQHLTLNINGTEYPGTTIRPPMLETQLTPAAWAYQIGFVQETRHA